MTIQKKERIETTYDGKIYEFAGRWQGYFIFAPVDAENDQCMVYTAGDIEELLETGEFRKVGCKK